MDFDSDGFFVVKSFCFFSFFLEGEKTYFQGGSLFIFFHLDRFVKQMNTKTQNTLHIFRDFP